jgi:serine/threonine protein kinase
VATVPWTNGRQRHWTDKRKRPWTDERQRVWTDPRQSPWTPCMIARVPLTPGSRLGVYEVLGPLGAGGMGAVYKGRDTRLDRFVAIKVVTDALSGNEDLRARFEHEARAVAALNHPNICIIHDVGRQGDTDYLVMELLNGETLAARLARGPLNVSESIDIAIQIGEALDAAHRAGIVHRDLKPGNVMLVPKGTQTGVTAKLLDFGVAAAGAAKTPAADSSIAATMAASMVATRSSLGSTPLAFSGTVQYMAPEQMESGSADTRSDIFAFGCVLYEMLAGRKAFEGTSAAAVIAAVMGLEPPPIEALRSEPLLEHLLRRCLAKDRERRWQSIRDVVEELRFISTQPLLTPSSAPVAKRSRARVAAIAAAAIIGSAAGLAGLLWARPRAAVTPPMQFEVTTPPTDDPAIALSPDGKFVAFVANENRRPKLWLRSLDKVDSKPVPGTEGARLPFWSPQGTSVAFFADGKLKRIEVATGATMVLADAPNARGGDWGEDGTILFAPNVSSGILRVPARGGATTVLTKPDGRSGHRNPQFLPDGKHFLFFSSLGPTDKNGVYFASFDGHPPVRLLPPDAGSDRFTFAAPDTLLVVRQGSLVAYRFDPDKGAIEAGEPRIVAHETSADSGIGAISASLNGSFTYRAGRGQLRRLVWVDRKGTESSQVGEASRNDIGSPELSPDEKSVVIFMHGATDNDIAVIDLTRGLRRLITNTPPADAHPLWDPDGRHVVFTAGRFSSALSAARAALDGGAPEPLFAKPIAGVVVSWTKDRRMLLLRREDEKTGADLAAVTLDGQETPVANSASDETEGQFSPDGKWVAFVSNEGGRPEVYLQSFPGREGRTQGSIAGGSQVRWAPGGNEIFYIAPDGQMMSAAVTFAAGADVKRAVPLFQTYLATGINVIGNKPQYVVSHDGRFLLNAIVETPSAPIVVWVHGLR